MRAVVQRVTEASVTVAEEIVGQIRHGLLVLLGIANGDGPADTAWMIRKLSSLRIFADEEGAMNLPILPTDGAFLIVSQFTLLGDVSRGNRPSFVAAAAPDVAEAACDDVIQGLRAAGFNVESGRFRTTMQVRSVNDGPVTILLDSRTRS